MNTNVEGKVKNTNLPQYKYLFPVYEAVVNAIHAIHESNETGGEITITVFRDRKDMLNIGKITGFEIYDNGIGFNDRNFISFNTSDSPHKENIGGKGLGRFMWLKAFDKVSVESHYSENGKTYVRKFDFIPKGEGIANESLEEYHGDFRQTVIKLHKSRIIHRRLRIVA